MRNRWLVYRMALFQLGFGLISVLVLGVLNRVMFAELGLPATLIVRSWSSGRNPYQCRSSVATFKKSRSCCSALGS